jgi:DNA polymerase-3 subunit beta
LPITKNGDARDVPLSKEARDLLNLIPYMDRVKLIPHNSNSFRLIWQRAIGKTELHNVVHFHDTRHEAITRFVNKRKLPVEILANGVNKAAFATADDDLRPTMTGIYFDIKSDDITFVATDAHKLVRLKNTSVKSGVDAAFILPKKPANMLKNIIAKESGDVEIRFDQKNIVFKLPSYVMVCRQIEGRFPNYNGVIPQNNPYKLIIDRLSLMNAIKRVYTFSNQGTGLIKLAISENTLVITAQDIDFSTSAKETMTCQYQGETINIGFKAPFLVDILNNINSGDVVIELADPSRAGIILPFENEANEELLMLLMPMLITE